jgi:uncharacterized membrane protein
MFDSPPDFFSLAIAIAALIFARKASVDAARLRARLDAMEASTAPAARPAPPPLADYQPAPATQPDLPVEPPRGSAEIAAIASASGGAAAAPPPPPLAPADPGFEERIGTRWAVWTGGLALALGGFFLVRYSIEAGLLGPRVRTFLGGLFALALLGSGEWTRRRESIADIEALPIANIPAILTAAGTAVAFATAYAAHALYDFIAPATAFILLGLVALATLLAALLHGPALAGLGVIGAFATPILVSSREPDYWALYIYLAIVTAAALGLARVRLWRWLAITTIVFALLWTLPCLQCGPSMLGPHAFHVIAGFVIAALLVVCGFMFGPEIEEGRSEPISSISLAAYLSGATLIVLASRHADAALITFAVLAAATLFVAWRAAAATGAVAAAAVLVFVVFAEWAVRGNPDVLVVPGGPLPGMGGPAMTDQSVTLHLIAAAIFAVGFGGAGFLSQGRSTSAIIPVVWSAAGVFTPLALLIALYARIAHLDRSIPFAILAIMLAAAFATATEVLARRDRRPGLMISTAVFATGTLGALALALTFALDKGWLTIALALMSLGASWIALQRPIPFLRTLAAILAAIVVLRVGYEPRIAGDALGSMPILNWLLWGYGVPAASFWIGSRFLRRNADDAALRTVEAAATLFTVLLAFLEIRHAIYDGDVYHPQSSLAEVALEVSVALALAIGLERLRVRSGSMIHNVAAVLLCVFAGLAGVFGLLLLGNPMFSTTTIHGAFVNLLLLAYALPAVLMLLLSYAVAGHRRRAYANTLAAGALIFALAYVTLEIRRLYHGHNLLEGLTIDAEQYTYSIAWLACGVVLFGIGVVGNSERARLASAAVIGLTILKAFVVDMSILTGVYRALSFIGLGLVLVAIGWLYQNILFRRRPPPTMPASPNP